MWPFSKNGPKVDKEWEAISKRYKIAEGFAKKGDSVIYLGVKMLVVGHHDFNSYCYNTPSIRVEWMDKTNRLQKTSIRDWEFSLCEVISTSENKDVSKSTPNK